MYTKLIKNTKYLIVFSISLLRFFFPIITKIHIQNYNSKQSSLVDFFLEINEKNIYIFFSLISKNLIYNYEQLINISCIDNINLQKHSMMNSDRFSLVYLINSINTTSRLLILISFSLNTIITSISSIYKASTWLEREVYDLFGIYFYEHKDLRRILTDYGFKGFPLRKDFPLTGYVELRFNEELKSVKYSRVKLIQEYRYFKFNSSWKSLAHQIKA